MFTVITLFLATAIACPIPQYLHPAFPKLARTPHLTVTETTSHIHAILTHPSLNETTTARVTLSSNPLTVHIQPVAQRPLTKRLSLKKTFSDVAIRAGRGVIQLSLRKTVDSLPDEIGKCEDGNRMTCLTLLAERVCQPPNVAFALSKLSCDDDCVQTVLEQCQTPSVLADVATMITQIIFGTVVGVMFITYGWGFVSAIISVPRELATFLCWVRHLVQRIQLEGMKLGIRDRLMTFV